MRFIKLLRKHWKKSLALLLFLFFLPNLYFFLSSYSSIYSLTEIEETETELNASVAIVFGAKVYSFGPSHAFSDRLSTAAELYEKGIVEKILISGDNGRDSYNEPESGMFFLTGTFNIPEGDIVLDYAGFRTYDTCVRAQKIWGIDSAILVTQAFHIPRAVFTCTVSGIESVGVKAVEYSYDRYWKNTLREFLAQQKAFYEVLFFPHDPKFLGETQEI